MAEYRVDDLARAAGTTVRSIRVYTDRGLLQPPRLQGRVGWYDDTHLARLRLVGQLQDRGYTLATIADLLTAWEDGRDLGTILGVETALTRSWTDQQPEHMSLLQLRSMFGTGLTARIVERAVRLGLLEREGTGFRVPSPALLDMGAELVRTGIPLREVLDLSEKLVVDMRRIADRFVDAIGPRLSDAGAHASDGLPTSERLAEIGETVERLRPKAVAAVSVWYEKALAEAIASFLADEVSHTRQQHRPEGTTGL
jgi:DNA-binding transcriptional MerR regulator